MDTLEPLLTQPRRTTRAERSCDICRRRKLKCVRETQQQRCVLCEFHQRECTYLDEPQQRRKRRRKRDVATTKNTDGVSATTEERRKRTKATNETSKTTVTTLATDPIDVNETTDIPNNPGYECLSLSLGLHPTTHFKYIGPGSLHEDMLLDFIDPAYRYHNEQDASKFCRVAEGVTFLARTDSAVDGVSDTSQADAEEVERLVHPRGPGLVDLYFRFIHPSYPILHKGVFLERYRRSDRTTFLPASLLAAVYLLALDWWDYDPEHTGPGPGSSDDQSNLRPDSVALSRLASQSLTTAILRPKLSTIQACLLLLQRASVQRGPVTASGGGDTWVVSSQLVAVAEELGLHIDCTEWSIPVWEKGLRKRLAWAVFMQDKWSSLIYGRPSHVQAEHWRIPQLILEDFDEQNEEDSRREANDDEGDLVEVEKGRLLFIHLARLTEVMAEALTTFYSHDTVRHAVFSLSDGMHTIELVKAVALRLRAWATALPSCLRMEAIRPRKLCSNGYLHLSYFVTEIMVYRCIVRSLGRRPPLLQLSETVPPGEAQEPYPETLVNICREAAKTRLLHVMRFVEALRPEHLQAFWWFASAKSLAYIRTYVSILWATSQSADEADYYRQKLDEFRWSLHVRARGVAFVTAALRDMGESLEDIDMTQPPFERRMLAATKRMVPTHTPASSTEDERQINGDTMGSEPGSGPGTTGGTGIDGERGDGSSRMAVIPVTNQHSVRNSFPGDTGTLNIGPISDVDINSDLDDVVLQTTPEFLADFGVAATEAFFADINSLQLYTLNSSGLDGL